MFIQVAVRTKEEFDRAFNKMYTLGKVTTGAMSEELEFRSAGYVKFNPHPSMNYFWYSEMDMRPIADAFAENEFIGGFTHFSIDEFEAI